MGSLQAQEFASLTDTDTGLRWHLQSNHYPPVPLSMLPVCKAAIRCCDDEHFDCLIPLPDGIRYRGDLRAPAQAIVSNYHLEPWLAQNQEDNELD